MGHCFLVSSKWYGFDGINELVKAVLVHPFGAYFSYLSSL